MQDEIKPILWVKLPLNVAHETIEETREVLKEMEIEKQYFVIITSGQCELKVLNGIIGKFRMWIYKVFKK